VAIAIAEVGAALFAPVFTGLCIVYIRLAHRHYHGRFVPLWCALCGTSMNHSCVPAKDSTKARVLATWLPSLTPAMLRRPS
jgi:hypothetical protein